MRLAAWLAAASIVCASAANTQAQPRAANASQSAPLTESAELQPRAADAARYAPAIVSSDAIQLDVLDCAQVSGARVREIVALEVAPRHVLAVGSTGRAATHALLSCPAGVAQISVEDVTRAKPLHIEIVLRDLDPPARSRLVALAIAELITTSKLQSSKQVAGSRAANSAASSGGLAAGSKRSSAAGEAATSRDVEALGAGHVDAASAAAEGGSGVAPDDVLAVTMADADAAAGRDVVPDSDDVAAVGGEAEIGAQLWLGIGAARIAEPIMFAPAASGGVSAYWRALALHADFRFEHAQMTRSVAELQLDSGSLALVPAWRLHGRVVDVSVGPGLRAGYATMHATPREPALLGQTVSGFWLAPCAQLALQLRFAERWAVRIGAELAYITRTLRGVDSNGDSVLALRDLALAAQLGVSWDALAFR